MELQAFIAKFSATGKPVGTICHGVLSWRGARTLKGSACWRVGVRRVWHGAWNAADRLLTFWKLGRYYRTYPAYVEGEVVATLASPDWFQRGPRETKRGTRTDHRHAFVVEDGNYVSARWPGDSYLFAELFVEKLQAQPAGLGR